MGNIMNLDKDKFYNFLQEHIDTTRSSPSPLIINKIKRYSRNNIISKNKFFNIFELKFVATYASLLIIAFLLFSNYFSATEIYVYEEQLLNIDMQTSFVIQDILSNDDLAIQHILLHTN